MTTLPTWAFVLLGLTGPFVAVVAIIAQVSLERSRQRHERALRLRDDRLRAYAALARLTNSVAAHEPLKTREFSEAYSEIEMLTDSAQLKEAANRLLEATVEAWHTARNTVEQGGGDPYGTPQYNVVRNRLEECRRDFIRLAQEELNAPEQRGPWWRRWFGW
jgi:hypothetical protein